MPRPHLFLRQQRPAWHFLLIGCILGLALLAALEYAKPWHNAEATISHNKWNSITHGNPTPSQHAAAVADGWIPGTDGYFRFIFGPDAY